MYKEREFEQCYKNSGLGKTVKLSLSLSLLISLSACSAFQSPFVESKVQRPGVKYEQVNNQFKLARDENNHPIPTSVSTRAVEEYARFLQDAYRERAGQRIVERRIFDMGLIGTVLTALGFVALDGSRDVATILGLTGAGTAFASDRFLATTQNRMYFTGAQALECVIGAATTHSSGNSLRELDYITLKSNLNSALTNVKSEFDKSYTALYPTTKIFIKHQISSAQMLYQSIDLIKDEINPLGRILLSKVEAIRIAVDVEVNRLEPDPLQLNENLKDSLAGPSNIINAQNPGSPDVTPVKAYSITDQSKLENAVNMLTQTMEDTINSLKALKIERVENYPETLFDSCKFADIQKADQINLAIKSLSHPNETAATLFIPIQDGKGPFTLLNKTIGGVTAEFAEGNPRQIKIDIPKIKVTEEKNINFTIRDSRNDHATFELKLLK